jgi:hypothetical protein
MFKIINAKAPPPLDQILSHPVQNLKTCSLKFILNFCLSLASGHSSENSVFMSCFSHQRCVCSLSFSYFHSHSKQCWNSHASGHVIWQMVPIHITKYTIHIHWSGKGWRKSSKGNLHSFGSPQFMSASAKPLSSGMSKTIMKPEIDITKDLYTLYNSWERLLMRKN